MRERLVDWQGGANSWKEASERLQNLIDRAWSARQRLPVVIRMKVYAQEHLEVEVAVTVPANPAYSNFELERDE